MLSIGARVAFVASHVGDSTKTVETNYAKYIPDADFSRELVEESILKSETQVKPYGREAETGTAAGRQALKSL